MTPPRRALVACALALAGVAMLAALLLLPRDGAARTDRWQALRDAPLERTEVAAVRIGCFVYSGWLRTTSSATPAAGCATTWARPLEGYAICLWRSLTHRGAYLAGVGPRGYPRLSIRPARSCARTRRAIAAAPSASRCTRGAARRRRDHLLARGQHSASLRSLECTLASDADSDRACSGCPHHTAESRGLALTSCRRDFAISPRWSVRPPAATGAGPPGHALAGSPRSAGRERIVFFAASSSPRGHDDRLVELSIRAAGAVMRCPTCAPLHASRRGLA